MRIKGKIALVTGSTTGIGEAIARRFACEGARVMIHGRRRAEAEQVVNEIQEAGGEASYHLAQLEDPVACAGLIEATVRRFGGINILVNNAAVTDRGNIETTDARTFDHTIAINLRAPLLLIKGAMPYFRKSGGGCVLNIGSVNAYCGEANQLSYSIAKGGFMTLSRNLADAHGSERIRFVHFNVGWVLTANEHQLKVREGLPEDWPQSLPRAFAPAGRLLAPPEIAHFALAFVEDDGALVNGAVVELEQYPVIGRNPPKHVSIGPIDRKESSP